MNRVVVVAVLIAFLPAIFSCNNGIESGEVHEQKLDTNRLVKVELGSGLDEPMEIGITEEGKVIIIERKGGIKLYDPAVKAIKDITTLPVYSGQEDGLLGLALDPAYSKNKFIYLYYSPVGDTPMQRVSRFVFDNDSLHRSSEKKLLDIPTQRQECCHSAGSLAFGPGGNLFIAVGDNTNPHNPGYYNSTDERKGREFWDAQRTAGNTNDYRGKILRIHPEPDGTYSIPEGNLFAKGTDKTKPEIYVMGTRNPYRINVDQKNGWLYWGDVGQNTVDDPKRGPISYDEWNVATKAGFFGWPYFAGPNAAYTEFNWETNQIGPFFDSAKPVNKSVNNTGLTELPPAQSALIWYSYDESKIFPHLGTGGKSPVSGPVFYTELYKDRINDTTRHLHEYYNGKVFIAEWMRDWINVLTVNKDGRIDSIETFMPGTKFNHPIELELGPDGALYILEYGTNWFAKNKDAGLFRIEYLRGEQAQQKSVTKKTDNAEPEIYLDVKNGNRSFYWPGSSIEYSVDVVDREDGSLKEKTIAPDQVKISKSFTTMGTDLALVVQAHENVTSNEATLPLIQNSDCKACHSMSQKSVGPSYRAIAEKYKSDPSTISKLAGKIISGGAGVWGEHAMSAHPQLSNEDARQMVEYILSLKEDASSTTRLAPEGKFTPTAKESNQKGDYVITVSYKDKEQPGTSSNEARRTFYIRHPRVMATAANNDKGVEREGNNAVRFNEQDSWIMFGELDVTGITSLKLDFVDAADAGSLTVKIGSVEGEEIGSIDFPGNNGNAAQAVLNLKKTTGVYDLYFVYKRKQPDENNARRFSLKSITFNKK